MDFIIREDENGTLLFHLKTIMKKRNISQGDLEKALGKSYNQAGNIKNGHFVAISMDSILSICRFLDCQPGDIFTYSKKYKGRTAVKDSPEPPPLAAQLTRLSYADLKSIKTDLIERVHEDNTDFYSDRLEMVSMELNKRLHADILGN